MKYTYLGDRLTAEYLRGMQCDPVLREGKCVRGRNGSMEVIDANGVRFNVIGRLLRKNKSEASDGR